MTGDFEIERIKIHRESFATICNRLPVQEMPKLVKSKGKIFFYAPENIFRLFLNGLGL